MSNEKSPSKNKSHVPTNVLKWSEPFGEVSPRALVFHTHTHTHTLSLEEEMLSYC